MNTHGILRTAQAESSRPRLAVSSELKSAKVAANRSAVLRPWVLVAGG